MEYTEADDLFFAIVQEGGTPMFASVADTIYPKTYRAMFGFCSKTNALKTAMFDMVEAENPYAFKALLRCYCDHYLKFTYLFVGFLREHSDEVGREYFSYCGVIESRDWLNAVTAAEGLVGNPVVGNMRGAIDTVYPDIQQMSNSELEAASAKFRYRSILRFLSAEAPQLVSQETPFLASIIPVYAELSSFVHGGPWSDRDMYTYRDARTIENCRENASMAFLMSASVFMFTALAVSREFPIHKELVSRTKAVIDRFLARNQAK
jgi:hypothetical protein